MLRSTPSLTVIRTDKNLGPAIINTNQYRERAYTDHLNDQTTYRELSETAALGRIKAVRRMLNHFIARDSLSDDDRRFLKRSTKTTEPFGRFYLLAKVHKQPWKTRPIVSYTGTLLHGLGRWLDHQLQKIVRILPYVTTSSASLVAHLRHRNFPPGSKLITIDATSMYTNINTTHALQKISDFLKNSTICRHVDINPDDVITALTIIMRHNVFRFDSRYWVQLTGTAMGAPPAPTYATIYFAIHEMATIPQFPNITFYTRYIDDGLLVWTPSSTKSPKDFLSAINNYGTLRWTMETPSTTADFLDVTLTLKHDKLHTKIFEKALNLYLYIPPRSCHPPGMLKGLIFGTVYRLRTLNSDPNDTIRGIRLLASRLRRRGHSNTIIVRHIKEACQRPFPTVAPQTVTHTVSDDMTPPTDRHPTPRIRSQQPTSLATHPHSFPNIPQPSNPSTPTTAVLPDCPTPPTAPTTSTKPDCNTNQRSAPTADLSNTERLFLHLPYHPGNLSNRTVRQLFETTIMTPPDGPPLHQMSNHVGTTLPTFSLTIAHSRPPNLGERVAPTYVTFNDADTNTNTNDNHNDANSVANTTSLQNTSPELL